MKNEILSILAAAMISVESNGNPQATGPDGEVGLLQIRPILVEDVNHFSPYKYKMEDRLTYDGSIGMFFLYSRHYATTPEEAARVWNGGPQGMSKRQTRAYWQRVRVQLRKNGYDDNCQPLRAYQQRQRVAPTRPSKR